MRINHNIAALNTHRQLNSASSAQGKSMEKLSSGLRINRAGDDAAGLAISEKMRGQIRGLDQASKNAQDGISLIATAEGALNETHDILQRARELAVQSSNDTATLDDRKEIQKEVNQLLSEVDRISTQTEFNTQSLLDGSYSGKSFHIGANKDQTMAISISAMGTANMGTAGTATGSDTMISTDFSTNSVSVNIGNTTFELTEDYTGKMDKLAADLTAAFKSTEGVEFSGNGTTLSMNSTSAFTVTVVDGANGTGGAAATFTTGTQTVAASGTSGVALNTLNVDPTSATSGGVLTQTDAETAIKSFDNAIKTVSAERSKLGAAQNRLEHTINNLGTSSENLTAAESRIRDVDYALAA
jgi:flagellin